MAASGNSSTRLRLSAPVYFACVALVTALGMGVAMLFRPALAHSIRSVMGLEKPPLAVPGSFYTARVAPLFEEHCTGCHGAGRRKAELRLDSLAGTLRGSKHGAVILAGNLKGSELVTRLTLPPGNEKAMPPSSKPPMSADEVTVIKLWIAAGASGASPVAAIKGAPAPVMKIQFPEIDEASVAQARAPLVSMVKQLQARFPGVLSYESRGSADLQINASLLGRSFGDKEFAALAPLRERIVWADLSGTSISDASAQTLTECKQLRTLLLSNTGVTDVTTRTLTSLHALKSLTVVGTTLTESNLADLRGKGVRVYDGHETRSDSNATS
jgi:Planctomycete cytochrome C